MTPPNHERFEALLVKASDGLLDEAESREFFTHIEACASCREELEGFTRLKEMTDMLRDRIALDARVGLKREPPAVRHWVQAMTALVLVGALVLLSQAAYELIQEEPPTVFLIGIAVVTAGILGLIAPPLIRRLTHARHDPYQEIDL